MQEKCMLKKEEVPGKNNYTRNFCKMPVPFQAGFKTSAGVHFRYEAKF